MPVSLFPAAHLRRSLCSMGHNRRPWRGKGGAQPQNPCTVARVTSQAQYYRGHCCNPPALTPRALTGSMGDTAADYSGRCHPHDRQRTQRLLAAHSRIHEKLLPRLRLPQQRPHPQRHSRALRGNSSRDRWAQKRAVPVSPIFARLPFSRSRQISAHAHRDAKYQP